MCSARGLHTQRKRDHAPTPVQPLRTAERTSHQLLRQGNNMTDTIELLESIGRDASLRHASGENLSRALTGMQASEGLKQAAISGDSNHLKQELGHKANKAAQVHQIPTHGGCGGDGEDDQGEDKRDQDGEHKQDEETDNS